MELHPFAVSGLRLSYHLYADEGKRVYDVSLEDGSKIQPETLYTVSYIEGAFPEDKFAVTENQITMTDALRNYIIAQGKVSPDKNRIGCKD